MLSSSFSCYFFIQLTFITIFYKYTINGTNVTFVPEPIHLAVDDLPAPYATPSVTKVSHILPVPDNPTLYVPDGFTVKLYMDGLINPRYLIYTPSGDILVSEPNENRISCLIDNDDDGYPDDRQIFANASNGLNRPYDMAFADGYFYVDNQNDTRRYSWTNGSRQIEGTGEIVMSYDQEGLWTRTIVVSPDNDRIYIGVGAASNASVEPLPRATIQITNIVVDGNASTFASGLKNPVGLGFHPVTKDLYVACQERDGLGDDLVPNYFTRIEQNDFYGWPYAYMSSNFTDPRRRLPDGSSERPDLVNITRTPDVLFQAHSAVLDTLFYTGAQFPTRYHNGVFAAFHGSMNRNISIGYSIVFIPFNDTTHRPLGYYEEFVKGFLTNPQESDTFGRPVGLLVLKDGSLLFTEDGNNRIYQVQYGKTNNNKSQRLIVTKFLFITSIFISSFIMRK